MDCIEKYICRLRRGLRKESGRLLRLAIVLLHLFTFARGFARLDIDYFFAGTISDM